MRLSLLTCLCLLPLWTGCGALQAPPWTPDPPPPALAAPCDPGPAYPPGDPRLADLLDVVAQREAAAADCRDRHKGLVQAWPR